MLVGTTYSHVISFKKFSKNFVLGADISVLAHRYVDLSVFDCIVIHYSVHIGNESEFPEELAEKLARFSGLKALFIQDEMRWVDSTCDKIEKLGISLVFTVVNPEIVRDIYRTPWFDQVRFEHVLTGYVPEELLKIEVPAYEDRPIDVSYRARKLPAWCGAFGQEKSIIADRFLSDATDWLLKCDISCQESDRIYGDDWFRFLANSKATLGAESGSSFIDYSGKIAPDVDAYEMSHPETSFEDLQDRFLEGRDGQTVIHVVSPRCFEAAALRTLMIMYESSYSGILEAGRHYVPLARDHSNMKEVVSIVRDPERAKSIVEAAYQEIACSSRWSYATFIEQFDRAVSEEWGKLGIPSCLPIKSGQAHAYAAKFERIRLRQMRKERRGSQRRRLAKYIADFYDGFIEFGLVNSNPRFIKSLFHVMKKSRKPLKKIVARIVLR